MADNLIFYFSYFVGGRLAIEIVTLRLKLSFGFTAVVHPRNIRGTLADCKRQIFIKILQLFLIFTASIFTCHGRKSWRQICIFSNFFRRCSIPAVLGGYYADHMRYIAVIWRFVIFVNFFLKIIFTYRVLPRRLFTAGVRRVLDTKTKPQVSQCE